MDKILIEGGVPLRGEVRISGSKNAALPILFATLLTDDECVLDNVPDLVDIKTTCSLLEFLGKRIVREGHIVTVRADKDKLHTEAPYELVRKMRASALVLGPLLARTGQASASLPGGCAIGVRPINIHLSAFESLGAQTELSEGMVRLRADRLKGRRIRFSFPSVGATENLLMAAVLAQGKTVLENAAREPEIVDCANFLNEMGADIRGAGKSTITIHGKLKLRGARHRVIPDRIEAATYLIAGAITGGNVACRGASARDLDAVLKVMKRAGLQVRVSKDPEVAGADRIECGFGKSLRPISVKTAPHPGFPTDVQAQWMTLMTLAKGKCVIQETVFENRYLHAAELMRMGARIEVRDRKATVFGVQKLSGAHVMVSDLRAGAAMILAGLAAGGKTLVHRVYHLDRGYEALERKLESLGARIRRIR